MWTFSHVLHCPEIKLKLKENSTITRDCQVSKGQNGSYSYMRIFCNLIGYRAVVFELNLKYLHVTITNLLWVVE